MDEAEALDRARAGDHEAYAVLVRTHFAAAVRLASAVCGASGAEDAAQEAFVKVFQRLDRVRPGAPLRRREAATGCAVGREPASVQRCTDC